MSEVSLGETLLPALVQCFGIIFIGYILGRTKILRPLEAKGLCVFVQYLALPSLIFKTISTMPFTEVKWEFIASVFVSKACIFMCVALITMLLTHPINLGKSALFSIASTQSNDFALGYPLLVSLYQDTYPEYPSYLYIIAPIQLLILNTIGFFMLEIERHNQTITRHSDCHLFTVIKGTLQNPVVIMTLVGLIWNVTYGQQVLPIFENILNAFSSAFPAAALLLVGYTMTVKTEKQSSQFSLLVLLLILTKNLILPLILQKFSAFFLQDSTPREIQSLSSFGFLYGTIPTAPTAYVFAVQYDTCVDIVTKTVIGSTLLAAPLMFASASVISLAQIGIEHVVFYLSQTIAYLSAVNFVCCIWSVIIFCCGKRWKSVSFGVIFYLILVQFFMALGGILLFFTPDDFTILFYVQYFLTNGSIYATRTGSLFLAILLLSIRIRSLCFILLHKKIINILSIVFCFVLPYAIAASLLTCKDIKSYGPNLQLGYVQTIVTIIITFCCITGIILCLILHQIYLRRNKRQNEDQNSYYYQSSHLEYTTSPSDSCPPVTLCSDIEDIGKNLGNEHCTESNNLTNSCMYDRICDSNYSCDATQRSECTSRMITYISQNSEIGTGLIDDIYFFKHSMMLIVASVAMILSLFVCFWKLMMEEVNGIFIELEFLDVIINYSMGIVYFIMFGLDSHLLRAIYKKFKKVSSSDDTEPSESQQISERFLTNHYEECKKDIALAKLINNEICYVFKKSDLASWLIQAEISQTTDETEFFIHCLVNCHIIKKLNNDYNNLDYELYKFVSDNLSISL